MADETESASSTSTLETTFLGDPAFLAGAAAFGVVVESPTTSTEPPAVGS